MPYAFHEHRTRTTLRSVSESGANEITFEGRAGAEVKDRIALARPKPILEIEFGRIGRGGIDPVA